MLSPVGPHPLKRIQHLTQTAPFYLHRHIAGEISRNAFHFPTGQFSNCWQQHTKIVLCKSLIAKKITIFNALLF
jgi:hypothetical protein